MRKSSRGNPWHDSRGRFCSGPTEGGCRSERTAEEYEERTLLRKEQENGEEISVSERNVQGQRRSDEGNRKGGKGTGLRGSGTGSVYVLRTETDGHRFHELVENGRQSHPWGCCVDNHEPNELEEMKMFISEDGMTGVAVEDNGNICCAFNSNPERDAVPYLLQKAKENGGTKMDCYGRQLVNMYEENGFMVVARIPYNGDYVEDNEFNRKLIENQPDVYVLMKRPEHKEKHISTQAELDSLLTFDGDDGYDEAMAYRDRLLREAA